MSLAGAAAARATALDRRGAWAVRAAAPAWLPAPRCEGGPADCERAGVDALTLDEGAAGACLVRPAACEPAPPRLAEAGAAIPRRSDSADGAADGGIFVFVVAEATTTAADRNRKKKIQE